MGRRELRARAPNQPSSRRSRGEAVSDPKDDKETTAKKVVPKARPTEKDDIAARNTDKQKAGEYHLEEGHAWANAWKFAAGAAVIGLGAAFAGGASDPKRFAFSYLFAFLAILTP